MHFLLRPHTVSRHLVAVVAALTLSGSALVVLAAPAAHALDVIAVTTTADGGAGSLRAAFATANADGDDSEIVLQVGAVYVLHTCPGTDEDANANGDLDHTPDGEALVITGNGATIHQTCAGERVVDDLGDGALIVRNVVITGGSTTGDGGGVRTQDPAAFEGVTVTGNHAEGDGGGIASTFGVVVTGSNVSGNTADGDGGGIDSSGGGTTTTIVGSTVAGNTAGGEGGGIVASGGGASFTMTSSTVSGNTADGAGGGVLAGGGGSATNVVGSTVAGNRSDAEGGGVAAGGGTSTHKYQNSTVTGNTAALGGGIASSRDAGVELTYTTIADNTASTGANVAMYSFGAPEDTDWGNLVAFGSVVANPHGGFACRLPGPPTLSSGYNFDTDGTCGFGSGPGDVDDGPDPQLGGITDNGGSTPTRLPGAGSPLIDAIPPASCLPMLAFDQRAIDRPMDGDANGTLGCDIGSVEVNIVRIFGQDAIDTSIAISQAGYPVVGSASAVVLARSDFFSDALAGGPLAAAEDGPLLITPGVSQSATLDARVLDEIERVLPVGATVFVLGGTLALAPGIDSALTGLGYVVERVAGTNLYATAVAIAEQLGNPATIFEATGLDFPDALSAVPAAIDTGGAILLTAGTTQAPETAAYLFAHPPATRYAIGGPLAAWGADPGATPVFGNDLYDTSAAVADKFFPNPVGFGIATGLNYPDALSGGVYMATGSRLGPVLLVSTHLPLPPSVAAYIAGLPPTEGYVFGGPLAVGDDVKAAILALF